MTKELLAVLKMRDNYSKEATIDGIEEIKILEELKPHTRILTDPPLGMLREVGHISTLGSYHGAKIIETTKGIFLDCACREKIKKTVMKFLMNKRKVK